MRKRPQRLECPACVGVVLETGSVSNGAMLDHCPRCGGTWLMHGQIPRLRAESTRAVEIMIRRADDASFLCHDCHGPMHRDDASCRGCGWKNALECPDCTRPMRRETARNVTVDVCRLCEAVWLDHHELSAIWVGAATVALAQGNVGDTLSSLADASNALDLLDVFIHAPDLVIGAARGAGHVARAGMEVASHAPGVLSAVPEALVGFFEVAGDVAGTVFGVIADVASILDF